MSPFSDDSKTHDRDMLEREVEDLKVSFPEKKVERRMALDWSDYLSEESASRKPSALKAAFQHLTIPGIISLGGGLPLPAYFPIHSVDVTVPNIGKWTEEETATDGSALHIVKYTRENLPSSCAVAHGHRVHKRANGGAMILDPRIPTVGLSSTLQYGLGTGDPHLVAFPREHTQMVHSPPYEDWSTTLTCGNTYSFYTCCRMLLERGEYIVMEEYSYSSAISACGPLGIKIVGIEMDDQGMIATGLDRVLSNWDIAERGARKPRVIYLVPTGQNPTGASMGLQRRKDIYHVCQKHNLIILEDEPYYFLQMAPYTNTPTAPAEMSNIDLLKSLTPSFMSLDVDGRVIRMDSLSKTVAPGLRLAWLSGPTQLIERAIRHLELTTQAPSGLSQSVAYDLLAKHWNHDGFLGWLNHLRKEYTRRRDIAAQALHDSLPKEVCSWTVPSAGMFFWIKITAPSSHQWRGSLETRIFERCLKEKVLVIPGEFFNAEGNPDEINSPERKEKFDGNGVCYFRGTFAAAEEFQVVEGIRRLGKSIRGEFGFRVD